jgi:hypothetical protein
VVSEVQVQTLSLYGPDSVHKSLKKIAKLNLKECLQCGRQIFLGKSVRILHVILMNSSLGAKIPNFNL